MAIISTIYVDGDGSSYSYTGSFGISALDYQDGWRIGSISGVDSHSITENAQNATFTVNVPWNSYSDVAIVTAQGGLDELGRDAITKTYRITIYNESSDTSGGSEDPTLGISLVDITRVTNNNSSSITVNTEENITVKYGPEYDTSETYEVGVDFTAGTDFSFTIDHTVSPNEHIVPVLIYTDSGAELLECIVHVSGSVSIDVTSHNLYKTSESILYTVDSSEQETDQSAIIYVPSLSIDSDENITITKPSIMKGSMSQAESGLYYFEGDINTSGLDGYLFGYQVESDETKATNPIILSTANIDEYSGDDSLITLISTSNSIIDVEDTNIRHRDWFNMKIPNNYVFTDEGNVGHLLYKTQSTTKPIRTVKILVTGNDEIKNAKYYLVYGDSRQFPIIPFNIGLMTSFKNVMHNLSDIEMDSEYVTNINLDKNIYHVQLKIEYNKNNIILIDDVKLIIGV